MPEEFKSNSEEPLEAADHQGVSIFELDLQMVEEAKAIADVPSNL